MKTYCAVAALAAAFVAVPALADEADDAGRPEIVVTGKRADETQRTPATAVTVTEQRIAETINAVTVEDTIKYLPSLVVRKRHIGDLFAPLATRTSGLGSSARSLIFADGAPLSALIANNNGIGSPRWSLVTPEEIARVDVLYGPFSAEYSGNSIGTVVNITTRMPERFEAQARALVSVQDFSLYGTERTLPSWQVAGSIGGRAGPLSLFLSATRTVSDGQPFTFVTAASAPAGTTGAFDDRNRTGGAIKVLGASDVEHHVQDTVKLKTALDLGGSTRLTYVVGLWRDESEGTAESYLANGSGQPVYTSAFSSGVSARRALNWSHALTLRGEGPRFDWRVTGTTYRYARGLQRTPTTMLPGGFAGGPGNVMRMEGTGWATLDGKAAWRPFGDDRTTLRFGFHADRYRLVADRFATADWAGEGHGALNQSSRGRTRTLALWAEDAWLISPELTVTVGSRYEWWRAWDGFNFSSSPALSVAQPERRAEGFSPKASLEWRPAEGWSGRLSLGQAWRFPTVGELYQAVTTGPTLTSPDPSLRPERARSAELAIERRTAMGTTRVSFFNEVIDDALIAQSGALPPAAGLFTYVQNVDRTRARGIELAIDQREVLPQVDLQASVTYADARTVKNTVFPVAVGKLLPSVPHWKASAVVTWRPAERWSLTAAARYSSRNWGTLENSDVVGNTYQGFYKYFVADLRATYRATDHLTVGLGIDNLTNAKYFLFHPFPQRSFSADVKWKL